MSLNNLPANRLFFCAHACVHIPS